MTRVFLLASVSVMAEVASAASVEPAFSIFDKIVNYGGLVAFALAMFYLFREQSSRFMELLGKQTESFLGEIRSQRQDHVLEQKNTREHCTQERQEALARYDRLASQLWERRFPPTDKASQ